MNLLRRVVSAAVLLAIVATALVAGGVAVSAMLVVVAAAAIWEFDHLARRLDGRLIAVVAYPLGVAAAVRFAAPPRVPVTEILLSTLIVAGLLVTVVRGHSWRSWAFSAAAVVYIGGGLGYFQGLVLWPGMDGTAHVRLAVVALAGPVAGDTAAYFAGSAWGRHRFFPAISPKKSVEGAVASLLASTIVVALLACWLLGYPRWWGAILGAMVNVAAQGGDLAESALKRQAEVKDSGGLIPGHGGLLDRLDSLLLVAPVVYWYLWVIRP